MPGEKDFGPLFVRLRDMMAPTRARYVSYHLIPIYVWPDLPPQLPRRKQGKSCLNFAALATRRRPSSTA